MSVDITQVIREYMSGEPIALADLKAQVGQEVGLSDWVLIDQDRINRFAEATDDFQFIHVNPDLAKMTPFGGTIAHGFLTLSLLAGLGPKTLRPLQGAVMGVNYGANRLRFIAPVREGSRVRARFVLKALDERVGNQVLTTYDATVEIEGQDKPALIAEWITMAVLMP